MSRRTPQHRRLAALVALLGVVLGTQALRAPSAGAAGFVPISGSGSTAVVSPVAVSDAPAGAKATVITFMVTPSGPVIQGTPLILVAQVAPANATGTIQFKDGDTELGMPRPVIGGFALTVTSKLTKGTHSLTAVFTAANQWAFGPSTAPASLLTVIALS